VRKLPHTNRKQREIMTLKGWKLNSSGILQVSSHIYEREWQIFTFYYLWIRYEQRKNRSANAMVVEIIYFLEIILWDGETIMNNVCRRPGHESSTILTWHWDLINKRRRQEEEKRASFHMTTGKNWYFDCRMEIEKDRMVPNS
jgi:hypothetical protein